MPKKRKPTAKKVGKKAAATPPERDTKQSAPRQAATKAKARRAKKSALRPRVRVAAQGPDVTHEKALLRDDLGKEDGPAREREQPEELIRGAADDDLAEELGEEFVESATSGEQAAATRRCPRSRAVHSSRRAGEASLRTARTRRTPKTRSQLRSRPRGERSDSPNLTPRRRRRAPSPPHDHLALVALPVFHEQLHSDEQILHPVHHLSKARIPGDLSSSIHNCFEASATCRFSLPSSAIDLAVSKSQSRSPQTRGPGGRAEGGQGEALAADQAPPGAARADGRGEGAVRSEVQLRCLSITRRRLETDPA